MNLFRYLWYASWQHPRFGVRIARGRVVGTHGKVPPRFLRELKTLKKLRDVKSGWIMAVNKGAGERLVFSRGIPASLHQPLRNLFMATRH